MQTNGISGAARLEEIFENLPKDGAANTQGSAPASWGADSLSISPEAMELCQAGISAEYRVERELLTELGGDSDLSIASDLQAIASTDFRKFLELLDKLRSPDPMMMLDAMAEISGVSRQEMQQTIENMSPEQLQQLATSLSAVTGASFADMMQKLEAIQELGAIG